MQCNAMWLMTAARLSEAQGEPGDQAAVRPGRQGEAHAQRDRRQPQHLAGDGAQVWAQGPHEAQAPNTGGIPAQVHVSLHACLVHCLLPYLHLYSLWSTKYHAFRCTSTVYVVCIGYKYIWETGRVYVATTEEQSTRRELLCLLYICVWLLPSTSSFYHRVNYTGNHSVFYTRNVHTYTGNGVCVSVCGNPDEWVHLTDRGCIAGLTCNS